MINIFEFSERECQYYSGIYFSSNKTPMGNTLIKLKDLVMHIPCDNLRIEKRKLPHEIMNFLIPRRYIQTLDKLSKIPENSEIFIKLWKQPSSRKFVIAEIDDDIRLY